MRRCDVFISLGLAVLCACLVGCTAIGYTAGSIIDSRARRPVPRSHWTDISPGRRVWVATEGGTTANGRFVAATATSLSLAILGQTKAASPWSFRAADRDTLVFTHASALSVPSTTYRKIGTFFGVAGDVALVMIWRHINSSPFNLPGLE